MVVKMKPKTIEIILLMCLIFITFIACYEIGYITGRNDYNKDIVCKPVVLTPAQQDSIDNELYRLVLPLNKYYGD